MSTSRTSNGAEGESAAVGGRWSGRGGLGQGDAAGLVDGDEKQRGPAENDRRVQRGAPAGRVERGEQRPGVGQYQETADRGAQDRDGEVADEPGRERGGEHPADEDAEHGDGGDALSA